MKILILGKLGLKLVFWKSISSHTHTFYSLYSMLWGVFSKTRLFFLKCYFFLEFRLIQSVFWSIETNFQSIKNREQAFLKVRSWIIQLTFSKVLKLFSLSPIRTRLHIKFLLFSSKLFARFSSLQAGMSILPFLFHLFSFLHAFFHAFKGYFRT